MKILKNAKISLIACAVASCSFLSAAPVFAAEAAIEHKEKHAEFTLKAGSLAARLEIADNNTVKPMTTLKTGIVKEDEGTVYLDTFGQKVTGWQIIDNKEYLFNEDGYMQTGFQELSGKTYFFKDSGEKAYEDVEKDGTKYHLQEDGQLLNGWKKNEDGTWVYYNEQGFALKDTTATIDGQRYAFDSQGIMITNQKLDDGYVYGENGVGREDVSGYQKIADAALAQVGVFQDCTMLVTNSLRAVGINFHGWPHEYLSLGPVTSSPVPGDIIVYQGHVAIYIGDGMAVHGGWLGNQTKVSTVECTNAFVAFVHPVLP